MNFKVEKIEILPLNFMDAFRYQVILKNDNGEIFQEIGTSQTVESCMDAILKYMDIIYGQTT